MNHKKLKSKLIEMDQYLYRSAQNMGIPYNRLSGYLSGRIKIPQKDQRKIGEYLKQKSA